MSTCGRKAVVQVLPGGVAVLCSPAKPCCANKGPVAELHGVDQPAPEPSICSVLKVPGRVLITCPQHLQWHCCGSQNHVHLAGTVFVWKTGSPTCNVQLEGPSVHKALTKI